MHKYFSRPVSTVKKGYVVKYTPHGHGDIVTDIKATNDGKTISLLRKNDKGEYEDFKATDRVHVQMTRI